MLEPQATAMLAGPTDDPLAAEPLTSLCFELITCGFPKLAIAVGERSVSCAEAGSNLMAQGFASLRFGEALHQRGDERAVPRLKLAVNKLRRVLESDPDNPTYLRALGTGLGALGNDYQGQGNLADAVGAHTESVTHYRRVLESDPDNQRWISELDRALQKLTDLRGTNEN